MNEPDPPEQFPAAPATFLLPGPAGVLELASDVPLTADARGGTALICHPNPAQGGTMQNKVVTTLERSLRELGLATVRFNFRGVGASTGAFDEGRGETDDALAVAAWIARVRPDDALWVAGFSFGGYVATRVAGLRATGQLITVAPAVTRLDFTDLPRPACPWMVIQGEADEVIDAQAVYDYLANHAPTATLIRVPETGHFFHRRLLDLRAIVQDNVRANLPARLVDP